VGGVDAAVIPARRRVVNPGPRYPDRLPDPALPHRDVRTEHTHTQAGRTSR
jgi:hypothetical protein